MSKIIRIDLDRLNDLPFDEYKIIKALVKIHFGQNMQQVVRDLDLTDEFGQQLVRFLVEQGGRQLLPLLFCEPLHDNFDQFVHTITHGMNDCLGTHYKTSDVRDFVQYWYEQGYTTPDVFVEVVQDRSRAWRDQPMLKTHLRPATLFGKKFMEYRNLAMIKPNAGRQVSMNDEFTGV